jgi:hypothetical protein
VNLAAPLDPAQLADIEAIRAVAMRYAHGLDRLDGDWMRSAYWPDAIDDHGVFVGNAWEFVDRCIESHPRWRSTMHCIFNLQVELDSDTSARGEIYNITYLFPRAGDGADVWVGRYLDAYERRGDEWRILHRVCVHEGTMHVDAAAMPIAAEQFRQGGFDRPSTNRPLGP